MFDFFDNGTDLRGTPLILNMSLKMMRKMFRAFSCKGVEELFCLRKMAIHCFRNEPLSSIGCEMPGFPKVSIKEVVYQRD